jgi:hypothetical protein
MSYAKEQMYPREAYIRASALGDSIQLHTPNSDYYLNNWTMKQLCGLSRAPAGYLTSLPTDLAVDCLNNSIGLLKDTGYSGFMLMSNSKDKDKDILRSVTSNRYSRIWDYDILTRIEGMQADGWQPPPPVKLSEGTQPAGMYRSDRDMFAFMINDEVRIDDGTDGGLSRGFFVSNSEVGGGSFVVKTFLYRHICGNHMVMGCSQIKEIRMRHVGKGLKGNALKTLARDLTVYANDSVLEDESRIANAKVKKIGSDSEEVIEFIFRQMGLSQTNATKAWDKCIEEEPDLDPTSVWGMVQGITALAREEDFTDARVRIEESATKLMELV